MCGVGGYVDFSGKPVDRGVLTAMCTSLARRGPDAHGVRVDGPCGLAHARLSVLDIEGSPQPMERDGGAFAITYNGEVYNFGALRDGLVGLGDTLHSRGDTEALLAWTAREWERAPVRFEGIYAMGVWDRGKQRLLLVRDPFGIKPLFVAQPRENLLVFGSEIKTLLAHPEVQAAPNEAGLRQALRFRAVYGDATMYDGVRPLSPGAWLEFSSNGVREGRFRDVLCEAWDLRDELGWRDQQSLIDDGERLLKEAVRDQLVADVPVGAFLSGGLDSSLLVAMMRELRGRGSEIRTYAVGFRDDPSSELGHARAVATAFGTRHTEVPVGESDYVAMFAEMSGCRDGPVSEPADLAVARMSEVAKRDVKVALSGEGADEVFAGYPKYLFARVPGALRAMCRGIGPDRMARAASVLGLDGRRAHVAARALSQIDEASRQVQWFSYIERAALAALFPGLGWDEPAWESTISAHRDVLRRVNGGTALARMQAMDWETWLPCNMLERGDRMTMSAGLEMRVPYLHSPLAVWGLALPDRMKVRGRVGKWVMRRWAKERLPAEIVTRPKWGFRTPLDQWLREGLRSMAHDYLTCERGLCAAYGDLNAIRSLLSNHDEGRCDAGLEIWTLLACEVWWQDVLRGRDRYGGRYSAAAADPMTVERSA